MFGYFKRKRAERAASEVLAIGERAVEVVNTALEEWRATSLEMRRTMTEDAFAERLVAIEASEAVPFEMGAEIEALACAKNWIERTEVYETEFYDRIDPDTRAILGTLNVEAEVQRQVTRNIQEVYDQLDDNLTQMIEEEAQRRA